MKELFFNLVSAVVNPLDLLIVFRITGVYFNAFAAYRNNYLRFMKNSAFCKLLMHSDTFKGIVGTKFDNNSAGRLI
jgi:hypothetical protein